MPKPFTNQTKFVATLHFREQMKNKGLTSDQVVSALTQPEKITSVTRYPGQWRFCGAGVAVIVSYARDGIPSLVTLYLDGIVTPLREDQKNDLAACNSGRIATIKESA